MDTGSSIIDETIHYELPDNIPKSSIVYDENDDLKTKALKLYSKYVQIGSDFEINVAHAIRTQLANKFEPSRFQRRVSQTFQRRLSNNKAPDTPTLSNVISASRNENGNGNEQNDDLSVIFDECCVVMVRLLRFSLSRFKTKPEWIKVQNFQAGK